MLAPIRGMYDVIGLEAKLQQTIIDQARALATLQGFDEIITPIIEQTQVFSRAVGESSDIVSKEMYTFEDRGGQSLCLRPEGTAGVMRAVLSQKMLQQVPLKFFYAGPMFRYERPQKGRQRQFTQLGVEHIGDASPYADAECIGLGARILEALKVQGITLELNTLGDAASRAAYKTALVSYLTPLKDKLSEDSQRRLGLNPLRILDSKDESDQYLLQNAPLLGDFLSPDAKTFFDQVQEGLHAVGVPFKINPQLVRGLDYYCHTAFEFKSSVLGAQSTVLAGGRYDDLSSMLGGPLLPSIGFAAGVERLALAAQHKPFSEPKVMVIPLGEAMITRALGLSTVIRACQYRAEVFYPATLKGGLKRANKIQAAWAVLLGEDEAARDEVVIKNLITGEQQSISSGAVESFFKDPS